MTHICVGKLTIIGSDNGTNAGILLIEPLGTNFREILIRIQKVFSFRKMRLKMSSAKWRPFCLRLNVLRPPKHFWLVPLPHQSQVLQEYLQTQCCWKTIWYTTGKRRYKVHTTYIFRDSELTAMHSVYSNPVMCLSITAQIHNSDMFLYTLPYQNAIRHQSTNGCPVVDPTLYHPSLQTHLLMPTLTVDYTHNQGSFCVCAQPMRDGVTV